MASRLLRLPDVIERTGLPKSTIYLRMKQGSFPHGIALSFRTVAWLEAEIEQWIADRVRVSRSHLQPPQAAS